MARILGVGRDGVSWRLEEVMLPMLWQDEAVQKMHRDGVARLPVTFNAEEVVKSLSTTRVANAHVWAKATAEQPYIKALEDKTWPMFCHTMTDIVVAPHILEGALSLYPLVKEYFQQEPLLYSMNCFWTQPVPPSVPKYKDTHWWHIDGDDDKQLVVFFMGTDIPTKYDGAHLYQRGSHRFYPNPTNERLGYNFEQPPESIVETIIGDAGTIFLTDPRGMHMAPRPLHRPRMLAWARFGVSDPPISYSWDKLSPVPRSLIRERYPQDPELQKAVHLVVA